MDVQDFKVKDLIEYQNNARINDETVELLAQSIETYGYQNPIIVNPEGVILSGHARKKALQKQGITTVTCIVVDMGEDLEKEFRILDNKIHELTKWDKDALQVELRGLDDIVEMFPELQSVAEVNLVVHKDVTQQQFDKAKEAQDSKFEKLTEAFTDKLVRIQCGGCGRTYKVKHEDLT